MYPKRLIEVDLPIKRISEHAKRDKSVRHGHISTLHIWWARRPLAACRAVVCATLWPDPADELCPESFREVAREVVGRWATENALIRLLSAESYSRFMTLRREPERIQDHLELRGALLDFIADFSNWDNSTKKEYLETSRRLTQTAHEALGGLAGTRPLVIDPFAGGGAIPLEALRIGADAFASDLNPVAVLLNKVLLEYVPRYGKQLAVEVSKWGKWLKDAARQELAQFYPVDPDGSVPIAYIWARTIKCEGPGCGVEIPLIRNMYLTPTGDRWHFVINENLSGELQVSVTKESHLVSNPTVSSGKAVCPRCNFTTPAKSVRVQLASMRGGADSARLLAVYVQSNKSRNFRSPTKADLSAVAVAQANRDERAIPGDRINPVRPYTNSRGLSAITRIGIHTFGDLYTSRQAIAIGKLRDLALSVPDDGLAQGLREAVITVLVLAVSRNIFQNCSLARWDASRGSIAGAFGKQALQVVWDFAEANPLSDGPANWDGALDWVIKVIEANSVLTHTGTVRKSAAQHQLLPNDSAQALITDPPYFAAIPYSDLSNVFYVWERSLMKQLHPDLYLDGLVDQEDEIIVTNANVGRAGVLKGADFFQKEMTRALEAARQVVAPDGIGVIVFADSSTASWEAILGAVLDAGWQITGSWPLDTELPNRTQAAGSASLQSSIHIICRPRETPDGALRVNDIGDWRDILDQLPRRLHDWMPRLASEGIVGADAIFACLGPALEVFSQYSRVEKASGEEVKLREYLERVWGAVAKEALNMIFEGADATGFEEDARLTAMWLWTLSTNDTKGQTSAEQTEDDEEDIDETSPQAGYVLEFDAARKIAQGLGVHLERLSSMVEVKGDKARLLPVSERTKYLFGKDGSTAMAMRRTSKQLSLFDMPEEEVQPSGRRDDLDVPPPGSSVLDRIHQSMLLFSAGRADALRRFLVNDGVGNDQRFWRLAQALSALYPADSSEKRWIDGVLARKKGLGF